MYFVLLHLFLLFPKYIYIYMYICVAHVCVRYDRQVYDNAWTYRACCQLFLLPLQLCAPACPVATLQHNAELIEARQISISMSTALTPALLIAGERVQQVVPLSIPWSRSPEICCC